MNNRNTGAGREKMDGFSDLHESVHIKVAHISSSDMCLTQ